MNVIVISQICNCIYVYVCVCSQWMIAMGHNNDSTAELHHKIEFYIPYKIILGSVIFGMRYTTIRMYIHFFYQLKCKIKYRFIFVFLDFCFPRFLLFETNSKSTEKKLTLQIYWFLLHIWYILDIFFLFCYSYTLS